MHAGASLHSAKTAVTKTVQRSHEPGTVHDSPWRWHRGSGSCTRSPLVTVAYKLAPWPSPRRTSSTTFSAKRSMISRSLALREAGRSPTCSPTIELGPSDRAFVRNRAFCARRGAYEGRAQPGQSLSWLESVDQAHPLRASSRRRPMATRALLARRRMPAANRSPAQERPKALLISACSRSPMTGWPRRCSTRTIAESTVRLLADNDKAHDRGADVIRLSEAGVARRGGRHRPPHAPQVRRL